MIRTRKIILKNQYITPPYVYNIAKKWSVASSTPSTIFTDLVDAHREFIANTAITKHPKYFLIGNDVLPYLLRSPQDIAEIGDLINAEETVVIKSSTIELFNIIDSKGIALVFYIENISAYHSVVLPNVV